MGAGFGSKARIGSQFSRRLPVADVAKAVNQNLGQIHITKKQKTSAKSESIAAPIKNRPRPEAPSSTAADFIRDALDNTDIPLLQDSSTNALFGIMPLVNPYYDAMPMASVLGNNAKPIGIKKRDNEPVRHEDLTREDNAVGIKAPLPAEPVKLLPNTPVTGQSINTMPQPLTHSVTRKVISISKPVKSAQEDVIIPTAAATRQHSPLVGQDTKMELLSKHQAKIIPPLVMTPVATAPVAFATLPPLHPVANIFTTTKQAVVASTKPTISPQDRNFSWIFPFSISKPSDMSLETSSIEVFEWTTPSVPSQYVSSEWQLAIEEMGVFGSELKESLKAKWLDIEKRYTTVKSTSNTASMQSSSNTASIAAPAPSGEFNWGSAGAAPTASGDMWECGACMVKNKKDQSKCISCETPNPTAAEQSSPKFAFGTPAAAPLSGGFNWASAGAAPSTSSDMWECGACMVKNKKDQSKCISCETPNPTAAEQSSPKFAFGTPAAALLSGGFNWASAGAAPCTSSDMWECGACMVKNKKEAAKCISCETDNPKGVSSAPLTSSFSFGQVAGTNPSQGTSFSFGTHFTSDTNSHIERKAGFDWNSSGFSASTNDGSWTCSACMVKNPASGMKCLSCETAK